MGTFHEFKSRLNWKKNDSIDRKKIKNHQVLILGKPELNISAAKSFKGDESLYNPEDLLLASLSSCHMMSYLYCCQREGVEIIDYVDEAEAILEVENEGNGRINKVKLKPIVHIKDLNQLSLAEKLHSKAHELCFIANSCNFEIIIQPKINLVYSK